MSWENDLKIQYEVEYPVMKHLNKLHFIKGVIAYLKVMYRKIYVNLVKVNHHFKTRV